MLKQRIISGLILAFTLTALIFSIGDVYLSYFVGIIASVSLWEYLRVRFSNLITLTILVAFVFCMYLSNILFFNILFLILGAITIFISAFLIISFPLNKNFLRNTYYPEKSDYPVIAQFTVEKELECIFDLSEYRSYPYIAFNAKTCYVSKEDENTYFCIEIPYTILGLNSFG